MTHFLLIRHAATDSVGQKLAGRTAGIHLNETGNRQARQLAARLAPLKIATIYSSPLERALETAQPIAETFKLQTIIKNEFLEIDFGEWTGTTFENLAQEPHFQLFNTFRSSTRIPGGELMLEAQIRFIQGMQELKKQHPGETIIIISHSDMIKAALAYYIGMPLDLFQRLEISPASVSMITLYDETAHILCINNTSELSIY